MENQPQNSQAQPENDPPRPPFGHSLEANFRTILDSIQQHDIHLLDDGERAFVKTYLAMSMPTKCLLLRLLMRKGPWFRVNLLSYMEVPDVEVALLELKKLELCVGQEGLPVAEACRVMLDMMQVADLKRVIQIACLNPSIMAGRKPDMLREVEKYMNDHLDNLGFMVLQDFTKILGDVVRVSETVHTIAHRFQLVYFLDESHSLTNFITADMGIVRWPRFKVSVKRSAFDDRASLLEYEIALRDAKRLHDAIEQKECVAIEAALEPAWACLEAGQHKLVNWQSGPLDPPNPVPGRRQPVKPLYLARFCSAWVYVTMASTGVGYLEKRKRYEEANDRLYSLLGGNCCPSKRGGWWDRLSTNLMTLKKETEAIEICDSSLADIWVRHGDRFALQRRLLRLTKPPRRWKKPAWANSVSRDLKHVRVFAMREMHPGIKPRYVAPNGDLLHAEKFALHHYATQGWKGRHVENGMWRTIFGLLMWDALFADNDDVFRTPFQNRPMDLYTDAFYPARRDLIEMQLDKIRAGGAGVMLNATWVAHQGEVCAGVDWDRQSVDELMDIVEAMRPNALGKLCELLAEEPQGWTGGMPDLVLWKHNALKLVEVKGPNDRLSPQQTIWLHVLDGMGVDVSIFRIVTKRRK